MAYKQAEPTKTIQEAALDTLIKRVRTIKLACANLDFAESRTPPDSGDRSSQSTDNYLVNVGSTPTDSQAAEAKQSRSTLEQIYSAMESKL